MKKPTYADLIRINKELKAQLPCYLESAHRDIVKASTNLMMASGVILELRALGGREIITPVMIADGLSDATIAAIQADLKRTYANHQRGLK